MLKRLNVVMLAMSLAISLAQPALSLDCHTPEPVSDRFKGLGGEAADRLAEQIALRSVAAFSLIAKAVPVSERLVSPDVNGFAAYIERYRIVSILKGPPEKEIYVLRSLYCEPCETDRSNVGKEMLYTKEEIVDLYLNSWDKSRMQLGDLPQEVVDDLRAIPDSVRYSLSPCPEELMSGYAPVDILITARLRWLRGEQDSEAMRRWGPPPGR